ncbi:hypothetical protein GRX01_01630 [Halobaculum sp. WSA2]|uniref:Uncharacterized protein n=1 Tax=Halobaculum saliterrae TaxID=2073113 RepID=A0A6B0STS0_9EURY|nr:hypothetical protein [Halobaculum saliterrae]MXR40061.1 hypothetical protein [Halobaculum saliterrae]
MDYLDDDWDLELKELLQESKEQQQDRLEEELKRIEQQLEERNQVHREVVDELESKLDWYKNRLEDLYKQRRGKAAERSQLKNQITLFYRQLRNEKQQHWCDKQELEQERRDLLRSIDELSSENLLDELF